MRVFRSCLWLLTLGLAFPPLLSAQENPQPPVIIDVSLTGCVPRDEICGDGVDQDCDGVDPGCPGADADWDGTPNNLDCEPNQRSVYPGVSVSCSASCGAGTKTCTAGGSYTTCTCTPLCEATAGGRCYYVSKFRGNDANPGTFERPFQSLAKISTAGTGAVALRAGDVVYVLSGVYQETVPFDGKRYGLFLRGLQGTASAPIQLKAYPGEHPVISPAVRAQGAMIFESKHVIFEGFEVLRAYEFGVAITGSEAIDARNLWVHDTDGVDNDNIAGVVFSHTVNSQLHHSRIHDNYDRTNADTLGKKTENSRNIVLFSGGNITLANNVIYQSQPTSAEKTGGCITYKHAATLADSKFEVRDSIFWNCAFHAIGSGSPRTYIHHNLIIDSEQSIRPAEYGGPCWLTEGRIEYNTVVGGQHGLAHFPYIESCAPLGVFAVKNNIFVHSAANSSGDGVVIVDPYGIDSAYNDVVDGRKLQFSGNCYWNKNGSAQFLLYSASRGANDSKGGTYSFSGWKGLGFDSGSNEVDPKLDSNYLPREGSCSTAGHSAGR